MLTIIATKTWTSDIPWQCVQVDHCSNTICPGRTVRGVGCKENPFYSLTNFVTDDPTVYPGYESTFTGLTSGYYNIPEILLGSGFPFIDYSGHGSKITQE